MMYTNAHYNTHYIGQLFIKQLLLVAPSGDPSISTCRILTNPSRRNKSFGRVKFWADRPGCAVGFHTVILSGFHLVSAVKCSTTARVKKVNVSMRSEGEFWALPLALPSPLVRRNSPARHAPAFADERPLLFPIAVGRFVSGCPRRVAICAGQLFEDADFSPLVPASPQGCARESDSSSLPRGAPPVDGLLRSSFSSSLTPYSYPRTRVSPRRGRVKETQLRSYSSNRIDPCGHLLDGLLTRDGKPL